VLERVRIFNDRYDEHWLQQMLFNHPEILPIEQIRAEYGPLIPIGLEINCGSGNIDNLYVNADGLLTVVETKLWRNPEARRAVVAQLIDYAQALSTWTFEKLDSICREKTQKGLVELARQDEAEELFDEASFIDNLVENLRKGRFLLLAVGDGIHSGLEQMVDYLNRAQNLHFHLALVEIGVHQTSAGFVLVPNVLMKTIEVEREFVRLKTDNGIELISETTQSSSDRKSGRTTLKDFNEFYDLLISTGVTQHRADCVKQIVSDFSEIPYIIVYSNKALMIKLIDPKGSSTKISVFYLWHDGFLHMGWPQQQLLKLGFSLDISSKLFDKIKELFNVPDAKISIQKDGLREFRNGTLPAELIVEKYPEFKAIVDEYTAAIYNA